MESIGYAMPQFGKSIWNVLRSREEVFQETMWIGEQHRKTPSFFLPGFHESYFDAFKNDLCMTLTVNADLGSLPTKKHCTLCKA